MSEDRLYRLFATVDGSLEPSDEFAEELFDSLSAGLGFRQKDRRTPIGLRTSRALGLDAMRTGPAARPMYLAATLALLLAVGLLGLAVGAALLNGPSAVEIVHQSIARYQAPPAFDMTVRMLDGSVARFLSDGSGDIRIESVTGRLLGEFPEGSYLVRTTAGQGTFDAQEHSWSQTAVPIPYPLFGLPLDWISSAAVPGATPATYACPEWQREPDETMAGRVAFHISCGDLSFWIDRESLLVLRRDDPAVRGRTGEAIGLSLAAPPAALFTLDRPAGAIDADHPPENTLLAIGSQPPDWSGKLLDGGVLDTTSLRGRPAVLYFWADWCPACFGAPLDAFASASQARGREASFVAVSWQPYSADQTQQRIAKSGGGFPTVTDDDGTITNSWGITAVPTLVLLDADGRVKSVTEGPLADGDLSRMVDALVSGVPVPTPASHSSTPATSPDPDATIPASSPPP